MRVGKKIRFFQLWEEEEEEGEECEMLIRSSGVSWFSEPISLQKSIESATG